LADSGEKQIHGKTVSGSTEKQGGYSGSVGRGGKGVRGQKAASQRAQREEEGCQRCSSGQSRMSESAISGFQKLRNRFLHNPPIQSKMRQRGKQTYLSKPLMSGVLMAPIRSNYWEEGQGKSMGVLKVLRKSQLHLGNHYLYQKKK